MQVKPRYRAWHRATGPSYALAPSKSKTHGVWCFHSPPQYLLSPEPSEVSSFYVRTLAPHSRVTATVLQSGWERKPNPEPRSSDPARPLPCPALAGCYVLSVSRRKACRERSGCEVGHDGLGTVNWAGSLDCRNTSTTYNCPQNTGFYTRRAAWQLEGKA